MKTSGSVFDEIRTRFEQESGLDGVEHELRQREGKGILLLSVASPTERLFEILEEVRNSLAPAEGPAPLATLVKKSGDNALRGPEGKLFRKTLAESLNIDRYSFKDSFLSRYTTSVAGAEALVIASANHVVFGRRGAGKSTLLLYALHTREEADRPSIWVDMQVYARREDEGIIADILNDLVHGISRYVGDTELYRKCSAALQEPGLTEEQIRVQLPALRRLLSHFASRGSDLFVFLDDFHVVSTSLQPRLLDMLYGLCRGNKVYLKLSAIETLTRTYEPEGKCGLEIPHDAQIIPLDYNLTMPDKATQHIEAILDSHAEFCGLPSVRRLCTSRDVVPRLTWVAAGVPRDALNLFSQAISKATLANRPRVSVSNVNEAASETVNTKLRDFESDARGQAHPLRELLDEIREFCVREQRRNAFLVEIKTDGSQYEGVRKLVDLRLLHVINEGITIQEAGRKYLALILDYGFYTGSRAARSVDLFNRQAARVDYRELRKLPVFRGGE